MKALEKDRARRYETANGLANDIKRYLGDEPVEACPPTTRYRLRKFARRNRMVLATVSAVALALVVGLVATTWQSIRATRESNRATQALQSEQRQRQRADANFQKAMDAVDEMLTEVAEDDLADIPHMVPIRRALLEKALAFYQEFLDEEGKDPEVRWEAARAQKRMGHILRMLGEPIRAGKHYRASIDQFAAIPSEGAEDEVRFARAEAIAALARTHSDMGQHEDAEKAYRQAIEIEKSLAKCVLETDEHRRALASSLIGLAETLLAQNRLAEAEKAYCEALDLVRNLARDSSNEGKNLSELANIHSDIG